MFKRLMFLPLALSVLLSVGCAVNSSTVETGYNIDEKAVNNIHDGRTSLVEVLQRFGAPTKTSRAGKQDLYVYKHCISDGSAVRIVGAGNQDTKEHCESLMVAVNRNTGIVSSHNLTDELDD